MTENEKLLLETMEILCCGERYAGCMSAVNGDGTCERWTYKNEAEALLEKSADHFCQIIQKRKKLTEDG